MPNIMPSYAVPDFYQDATGLDRFLQVDERLTRLDERALFFQSMSGLSVPWGERLLYRNACAVLHGQGGLVHLEDLVLLDGYAFSGAMYPDLSSALGILSLWKGALRGDARALLNATMPGEAARPLALEGSGPEGFERPDAFYDPDWNQVGRIEAWRHACHIAAKLPPLLAAFVAWDAWHTFIPEQQGPWRASLLASLTLAARGRTRGWLVPFDTGQWSLRKSWRASTAPTHRIMMYLDIAEAAVQHASKELAGLSAAKERMLLRIKDARKNSRLADLVDLLIARPLVSIPMACKTLRISKQAVAKMLTQLGSTPREISGRRRYRYWTVP